VLRSEACELLRETRRRTAAIRLTAADHPDHAKRSAAAARWAGLASP